MRALLFILCISVGFACSKKEKETSASNNNLKYYDSEIFSESNTSIYGRWQLDSVLGGFSGQGHATHFEYLEISPYGVYQLLRNDSIKEYGKVEIKIQQNDTLLIELQRDSLSGTLLYDTEKYVEFNGANTLQLIAPCCDRFSWSLSQ